MHALDRPLMGVTRVALELGRALASSHGCEVEYLTTYSRGPFREAGAHSTFLPGCQRVPGLMLFGGPLIALSARRLRLDIVHDPVGVSPFTLGRWAGSFRRVLTVHDAIAFRFPEGYSTTNNFLHRTYVPATLRHVDGVITVSEQSRADLGLFLRLRSDRVWTIPNGVSERFRPIDPSIAAVVAARYRLQRPFVLYVGTRQARKNVPGLIDAFGSLRAGHNCQLALTGRPPAPDDKLNRQISGLGLSSAVIFLGDVPDEDLPALYSASSLLAFPSLLEGFGLPVLEAMACGTPVVSSSASSLPEVAGDAALLVDPRDPAAMADAMARVLDDPSLRASLRERGLERARQFTWERAAAATLAVYQSVLALDSGSVRDAA